MSRRILVLSDLWLPFPGGAERLIYNVARDLMRRGNDVYAVTGYAGARQFDGPPVVGAELPLDERGWSFVVGQIAARWPDVILTHHLYADVFAAGLGSLGVPIVRLHYHGPRPDGAAVVVHISEHVAREAGALGFDLVLTPPAFGDVVADEHRDGIGFVKPIRHKGVELVYAIAAAMPDRRFVVLRGEWQDLEIVTGLPNVTYLEPVDDMREFYREVRLVLMPSLSEDAGTVAQEATLNGLPCISSSAGGLAETNTGGIQLDPDLMNVGSWCQAIRYLDEPDHYRDVVRSQTEALPDWTGTLDELAARIEAL